MRFASVTTVALANADDACLTPSTSQEGRPMKSNLLSRHLPALRLLLACLMLSTAPAWAADYASLVSQARTQLQNERYVEGLAAAKDAVRANPNDYKGHYYVAMAYLGMDRFDDAEIAAKRAQSLAPQSAKVGVEKLADAIQTRRAGTGSVQAADAALADGLAGKAARLYEQAWNAGQNTPELGLKAADLYANRLSQPVDAGRVLRQVKLAAKGTPAADQADAELKKLFIALRQIAQGHVKAARQQQGAEALKSLQQAEDADPGYTAIYKLRAKIAAAGDSAEALQQAIKDLARRNLATPATLASLPRMAQWLQQPAISEFLGDLLGSKQAAALRGMALNPTEISVSGKDCDECPEMVRIPGRNYEIGKYEVTQAQWEAVMGSNPSHFKGCDTCPVEQVSWNDVQDYLKVLNALTGKQYRLPTKSDWKIACDGGNAQEYCGSDNIDAVAWHEVNSGGKTHPVGQKQANGYGLHDMSGNVDEWMQDCSEDGCSHRITRGGSWSGPLRHLRADIDYFSSRSEFSFGSLGFRLARTLP